MRPWPDVYTHGNDNGNTHRVVVRHDHVAFVPKQPGIYEGTGWDGEVHVVTLTINGRATMTKLLKTLARVLGYEVRKRG